jgi:DNA-binding NarL/FixJ family response regulator
VSITVAIADDHPLMRKALSELLGSERDFTVLAQCANGDEALAAVRTYAPDILVLDLRMPKKDGMSVLKEMKQEGRATRVVLLAAAVDSEDVLEASRLGVRGIVLKEMAPRLLVQCLRKVHAGELWLERHSAASAIETLLRREAGTREISKLLTPREIEIARLAARGQRSKAIGDGMGISEGTVKTHLHSIYEKLRVRSRAELVLYCKEKGIV